jgi:ribose transport system substrate-binding protein
MAGWLRASWLGGAVAGLVLAGAGQAAEPFYEQPLVFDLSKPEQGPNGEPATPVSDIQLSADEVEQIRAGGYTAALLWAGAGEWYNAIGAGAETRLEELGIEVVARADAQFDPATQANDVGNALTLEPDVILTLIVDPVSGAEAFRPAVEKGVVLALADNGAAGWQAGREYTGIVTGDHFGMGRAAAELMSEALDGEGEVGFIFHDADFFVTNNRDNSFRAVIEQAMPGLIIVDAKGFTAENATFDLASAMLTQHPEIDGIYVAWDVAAEGVVEAIRAAGRADDVKVVTHDLGANNALDMAMGGIVYGTVADKPFDEGYALADLAAYGLLGKEVPPFSTVGLIKVTKDNLAEAWEESLNKPLPDIVKEQLQ